MFKKILSKPFFLSVTSLSVIACIFRTVLLATNIEDDTGFYIDDKSIIRFLFIAVILIALVFGISWRFILRKRGVLPVNLKFDLGKFFSERIILGLTAAGFAANLFYEIFRIVNPLETIQLPGSVAFFSVLTMILSALCLGYFVILSFLIENKKASRSIICIIPVIWVIFRLLRDFISFTIITTVSKNLMDVVYLCGLLIVLLSFSRIVTESDTSKGLKFFGICLPITIVLGYSLSIPNIIGFVAGFDFVGESDVFMHLVDFALSTYLLRASMHLYAEN